MDDILSTGKGAKQRSKLIIPEAPKLAKVGAAKREQDVMDQTVTAFMQAMHLLTVFQKEGTVVHIDPALFALVSKKIAQQNREPMNAPLPEAMIVFGVVIVPAEPAPDQPPETIN